MACIVGGRRWPPLACCHVPITRGTGQTGVRSEGDEKMAAASWDAVETSADVQGRIAQLWVYPVKSCAGVQVPAVRLDATGLAQELLVQGLPAAGGQHALAAITARGGSEQAVFVVQRLAVVVETQEGGSVNMHAASLTAPARRFIRMRL